MAKIRFSLREIHIIKAGGDGIFFHNGVDLYPCFKFNGSAAQVSGFGAKHNGLSTVGGHPFDDLWLDVEVPQGEFATLFVTYFESDNNHNAANELKDKPIEKLPSYALINTRQLSYAYASIAAGVDPEGNAYLDWYTDNEGANIAWYAALLYAIERLATATNKDEFYGAWAIRIEANEDGVYIATKGAGPGSSVFTGSPSLVKLEGKNETPIPKMWYWVHQKIDVGYSLVAQQVD